MSATTGQAARSDLVRRTRVGRQAIYDAQRAVAAYQLLFRCGAGGDEAAGDLATSQLIAGTFGTFGLDQISNGRPVFVNFTRAFVTGMIPIPLEPDSVVVEILDSMALDRELLLGLRALKDNGFRIAIGGYHGDVAHGAILELVDFVAIEVGQLTDNALPEVVGRARSAGATLLATGIEDAATLQLCLAQGFELFEGGHLQRPSVIEGRTLSPMQLVCVRLLNVLSDPELPMNQVEHMIGTDPGLVMRLLRTANAASSGLRSEVTSLRQAIVLLGPRRLRAWVVLTLIEGGATRSKPDELWAVLARAFACQKLATRERDLAYTIGLLSGCADLLGGDVAEVATTSGIGSQARAALMFGVGEAGSALAAVRAHERDEVDAITATGFAPFDVSRAYLESLSESLSIVHSLTPN